MICNVKEKHCFFLKIQHYKNNILVKLNSVATANANINLFYSKFNGCQIFMGHSQKANILNPKSNLKEIFHFNTVTIILAIIYLYFE